MPQESPQELSVTTRLHHLVARLVACAELNPLLDEVLDAIIQIQHADLGALQLYNPDTKSLKIAAQRGFHQSFLDHFGSVRDAVSAGGRAMLTGKRVIVEDVQSDPSFEVNRQIAAVAGFRAVQSTPLFSVDGTLLGIVSTHFREPHRPAERELELTDLYAGIAAEVIRWKLCEEELRKSETSYRQLFSEMPVGCTVNEIVCDERGNPVDRIYLEVNPAFEKLMGLQAADVIGKRMREILPETEQSWLERYGKVALTGEPMRFEGYLRPVDKYFDVSVFSPQRGLFATIFADITAAKTAEVDLRSLLRIGAALHSTLDVDSLLDALIVEVINLTNAEGGCAGLRTPEGVACRKYFSGSESVPFEYCWPPGVGWPGWVMVHKVPYLTNDAPNDPIIVPDIRKRFSIKSGIDTPLMDPQGKVIGFFEVNNKLGEGGFTRSDVEKLTAVSEIASIALQNTLAYRKLVETETSLQNLWRRLLRAQDDERRRIGRELHDALGQLLTALAMRLGVARRMLGTDEGKVQEALTESLAMAKECSDAVRSISYLLHSPALDDGGLAVALPPYIEGFSQRSGIQVKLEIQDDERELPREIEEALFRVVQQGLTNVHLHAEASNARVRVVRKPHEITVEVSDDGHGISSEILDRVRTRRVPPGVGIASMEERVGQLGGRLEIDSNPEGTAVTARVPLKMDG